MQVVRTSQSCPLYFLTPVWGAAYIDVLVDVVMPSQLAPGNLPAIKDGGQSRYLIFTTKEGREVLQASDVFRRVSEILPVDVLLIESSPKVPHDTMSDCYRRGIAAAEAAGGAPVFLTPDLVHADGNFAAIHRWLQEGRDAVFTTGIRTEKRGVVRALKPAFMGLDGAIVVRPRELARIGLDNLHAIGRASLFTEGEEDLIPANLYWRAAHAGLSARCFHLHPIVVRPQYPNASFRGTVDDDYVAVALPNHQNDYVVADSDEFMMIELSDARRIMPTNFRKGSVADVAEWAEQFANERHRRLFSVPIRVHAGIDDESVWRKAETDAAWVAEQIQRRLKRSTFQLMRSGDPDILRRFIRRGLDAGIERAKLRSGAATSLTWRILASYFVQASMAILVRGVYDGYRWIAAACSVALETARRVTYGTARRPRYFSFDRKPYLEINRAVADAVARTEGGGQMGGEPFAPHLRNLVVRFSQQGACVVDENTEERVSDGSLPLIVVDRNLPNAGALPAFFEAIGAALSTEGRLVIVAKNEGARPGFACMKAEAILASLRSAGFVISAQRRLDDHDAVITARLSAFNARLDSELRRRLRFFPLYALAHFCVVMPAGFVAKPVVDMVLWSCRRFGLNARDRGYFASVTVATKVMPWVRPSARNGERRHAAPENANKIEGTSNNDVSQCDRRLSSS